MIKSDIKKLHIELTNRCNAGCPFCGRTSSRPSGVTEFIEIGPGKVLSGLIKRIDRNLKVSAINTEEDIKQININNE